MAIGVGLFERGAAGFGGPVIVDINRLVDSAALRSALAAEPAADLVVGDIGDRAHGLIIEPGYPGIPARQFTRAYVVSKEFAGPAWIWISTRQWSEPAYLPLDRHGPARGRRVPASSPGSARGRRARCTWPAAAATTAAAPAAAIPAGPRSRCSTSGWPPTLTCAAACRSARSRPAPCTGRTSPRSSTTTHGTSSTSRGWRARWCSAPRWPRPSPRPGRCPPATAGWIALGLARALAHAARGRAHPRRGHPAQRGARRARARAHRPGTSRTALLAGPGSAGDDVLMLGATVFYAATGRSPWDDRTARPARRPRRSRPGAGCPPAWRHRARVPGRRARRRARPPRNCTRGWPARSASSRGPGCPTRSPRGSPSTRRSRRPAAGSAGRAAASDAPPPVGRLEPC